MIQAVLRIMLISVFMLMLSACPYAGELAAFTSDGCSVFPDGTISDSKKWLKCCVAHDKAYWLGGTYAERLAADNALEQCITSVENKQLVAAMWAGVRVGGSPYWFSPFRWSYGWPYSRGYRAVSDEEKAMAESLLNEFDAEE